MRLPMFPSAATTSRRTGSQAFTLPRPSRTCHRSDAPPGRSISAGVCPRGAPEWKVPRSDDADRQTDRQRNARPKPRRTTRIIHRS